MRRLVGQVLYGIQAAEDVKVSNIARALNETIPPIKTENRLCRNLARVDLTDRINRFLAWEGAGALHEDTVLALDLGDLSKKYARCMEHLATVRDGSTGDPANGYWLCEVPAAHPYGDRIVPLYGELYSQEAEGFESGNAGMLRAIERTVEVEPDGRRKTLRLHLGSMPVKLPERVHTPLGLVVIRGFGGAADHAPDERGADERPGTRRVDRGHLPDALEMRGGPGS